MSDKIDTQPPDYQGIKPSRRLKPTEQLFAQAYANPASATFGNATQSYLQAHPTVQYDTGRTEGPVLLAKPAIADTIVDIINKAGLGLEVRADSLHRIISHRDMGQSVSVVKRVEDKTITRTKAGPGYRDALKAIETLNKMDGTYDRNRAAADVAVAEYRDLRKRFFSGSVASKAAPRTHVQTAGEGSAPLVAPQPDAPVAGQVDTRRKPGRPRKRPAQGAGGGLNHPTGDVVSLLPTAGENSTGGGI